MGGLVIEKTGVYHSPWRVTIDSGPCKGQTVRTFPLKREAQAFINNHGHLPWDHLIDQREGLRPDAPLIVAVTSSHLEDLQREIKRLETEARVYHSATLHAPDGGRLVAEAREREARSQEQAHREAVERGFAS